MESKKLTQLTKSDALMVKTDLTTMQPVADEGASVSLDQPIKTKVVEVGTPQCHLQCQVEEVDHEYTGQELVQYDHYNATLEEALDFCKIHDLPIAAEVPFSSHFSGLESLTKTNYILTDIDEGTVPVCKSGIFDKMGTKLNVPLPKKTWNVLWAVLGCILFVFALKGVATIAQAGHPLVQDTRKSDATGPASSDVGSQDASEIRAEFYHLVEVCVVLGVLYFIPLLPFRDWYYNHLRKNIQWFYIPKMWPGNTDMAASENGKEWERVPIDSVLLTPDTVKVLGKLDQLGIKPATVSPREGISAKFTYGIFGSHRIKKVELLVPPVFVLVINGIVLLLKTDHQLMPKEKKITLFLKRIGMPLKMLAPHTENFQKSIA